MESITVGGLTFRWTDSVLIITTPTGQHMLNGRAAADLLTFLDVNRDEIFAVDQANGTPDWAQPKPPGRYVIGSVLNEQERRLPVTSRNRRSHRGSRRNTSTER
jgi:hypothetical protein